MKGWIVVARIVVILLAIVCLLMSICGGVVVATSLTARGGGQFALIGFIFLVAAGAAAFGLFLYQRALGYRNDNSN